MGDGKEDKDMVDKLLDLWWGKLVAAAFFAGLTAWLYTDFAKLESGEVESVSIWAPVAFLYNIGGMWGGLSIFIILTLLFLAWGIKQAVSGKE